MFRVTIKKRGNHMKKLFNCLVSVLMLFMTSAMTSSCTPSSNPKDTISTNEKHTISFYVDGECVKTIETAGYETLNFPENPKKDGYVFSGWGCTFPNGYTETYLTPTYYSNIPLTYDLKVIAQWKKTITIHFEMNGGQYVSSGDPGERPTGPLADEIIIEGNKCEQILTVIQKGDSAFAGWFDNPELEGERITDPYYPTKDVTLYAAWVDERRVMPEGGLWLDYYSELEGYVAWMYDGNPTELVIPSSYKGVPIVGISSNFYFKNYQTINNTVTTIKTSKNLKTIGNNAFQSCNKLSSVTISDTVEEIESNAFNIMSLENIQIGDSNSLKYIGKSAFGNVNDYYKPKWSENLSDGPVYLGDVFYGYKGRIEGSLTLKEGTTSIAGQSLYNQSQMTSLTIPSGVEIIGEEAFGNCSSMKSISLPETSLKEIYEYAFYNCSSLESLVMPNSVIKLHDGIFKNCANLKRITLSENLSELEYGYGMFENCGITNLIVPEKLDYLGNALYGNTTLKTITIKSARMDLDSLATIPESITAIYVHKDLINSFKEKFPDYADKVFVMVE